MAGSIALHTGRLYPLRPAFGAPAAAAGPHEAAPRAGHLPHIPAALIRLLALLSVLPLLVGATALAFAHLAFAGRVYPNVAVGGVMVGGLTSAEATSRINAHVAGALSHPLLLKADQDVFPTSLAELGVTLGDDAVSRAVASARLVGRSTETSLVARALASARHLFWLSRYGEDLPLPLTLRTDAARQAVTRVATRLDQPAADAHLELIVTETTYELFTLAAVAGRRVDVEGMLAQLRAFAANGALDQAKSAGATLELPLTFITPVVADADLVGLRARIDAIAGLPLVFNASSDTAYHLDPFALAGAVRLVGISPTAYYDAADAAGKRLPASVEVDESTITRLVTALVRQADTVGDAPRLEPQGSRVVLRPGTTGRLVDRDAAVGDSLRILRAGPSTTPGATGDAVRVVQLRYRAQVPTLNAAALAPTVAVANARLAQPLAFVYQDQLRVLPAADLARVLAFSGNAAMPVAELDQARLATLLAGWIPTWVRLDPALPAGQPTLESRGHPLVPGSAGLAFDFTALAAEAALGFRSPTPHERTVVLRQQLVTARRTETGIPASPATISPSIMSPAARSLVAEPVLLYSFAGQWEVSTDDLVASLRITGGRGQDAATLDVDALAARLDPVAREGRAHAQRLELRDAAGAVLRVDPHATAQAILAALQTGSRSAPVQWADTVS